MDKGVLRMDLEPLEELRKKPISASADRTRIPAIRMRQWYAPLGKLSCGVVFKRATLVAIRPNSVGVKEEDMGLGWIEEDFNGDWDGDRMYAEAVRMLVKERSHFMEMKAF